MANSPLSPSSYIKETYIYPLLRIYEAFQLLSRGLFPVVFRQLFHNFPTHLEMYGLPKINI